MLPDKLIGQNSTYWIAKATVEREVKIHSLKTVSRRALTK